MQVAIDQHEGLFDVVNACAEVVCEELAARTVTVTLLRNAIYRDLVKVGDYEPQEAVDPSEPFPMANYPEATARLLAHQAYVSSEPINGIVQEHLQILPPNLVSCFMGVPIVAEREVRGEIFVTRRAGEPQFTSDDVEVARDLATQLGVRFPKLVSDHEATNPGW